MTVNRPSPLVLRSNVSTRAPSPGKENGKTAVPLSPTHTTPRVRIPRTTRRNSDAAVPYPSPTTETPTSPRRASLASAHGRRNSTLPNLSTSTATPIPTTTFKLPKTLPRPHLPPVEVAKLLAIDSDLAGVPTPYVVERLKTLTEQLLHGLASVNTSDCGVMTSVPSSLALRVVHPKSDVSPTNHLPTHIVAYMHAKTNRCRLFPMHAIVYASQCAFMPTLTSDDDVKLETHPNLSTTITLPVLTFDIPHLESIALVNEYLYTHNAPYILSTLLPVPLTTLMQFKAPSSSTFNVPVNVRARMAYTIAKMYTLQALLEKARFLHGMWSNVVKLGVQDRELWQAMEVAWGVLVKAVEVAAALSYPPRS